MQGPELGKNAMVIGQGALRWLIESEEGSKCPG